MKKPIIATAMLLAALFVVQGAVAQHTLGFVAGYGMGSGRFQPTQESKGVWGLYSGGLTWRHYGAQRFVGCVGADLEFMQQGFSFVMNASQVEDPSQYLNYTRRVNSVMLPIVWQPHFYMLRNHIRVYFEAAATFSYNISSSYENQTAKKAGDPNWKGKYPFKLARDNRWGYGLAGGGGVAVLINRFELNFRVRYYFGYADIVRNSNKYSGNADDGPENPFFTSPQRSPMDNLTISVGLNYRFNKTGFDSWKPRPKRDKNKEVFKYGL